MVSLAYLVSIVCALAAFSVAEEVTNNGKEGQVDSKWLNYGYRWGASQYFGWSGLRINSWLNPYASSLYGGYSGFYGCAVLPGLYNNYYFAKDTKSQSLSRRAISLDAAELVRRGTEGTVTCSNDKGVPQVFVKTDCQKAANKLIEKNLSAASCGTCALSLVTPKDRVVPQQISASALEKTADGILNACSNPQNAKQVRRDGAQTAAPDSKQVAMILSKGDETKC